MCFDSSSTSTQATSNTDARVVGGDGSVNISSTGSITMTDAAAVHEAFGFAESVAADAFDMASASQIETGKTVKDALGQVSSAYSTAKAGEQKIFAGAALAIVGVVAVIAFKKG